MKQNNLALTFLGLVAIMASVGLVLEGTGSLNPTDVVGYSELTGEVVNDPAICTPVSKVPPGFGACCDKYGRCKDTSEKSCYTLFGIRWIAGGKCAFFSNSPCS